MKKSKFILTVAVAALALVSCRKQNASNPTNLANVATETQNSGSKEIEQKPYNLPASRVVDLIKQFKSGQSNVIAARHGDFVLTDSIIPVDSSLFLVEAVLNYDFDRGLNEGRQPETSQEKILFPEFIQPLYVNGAVYVRSSDIYRLHNYFSSEFTARTRSSRKIKCADLIAQMTPNGVKYGFDVTYLEYGKQGAPYSPDCSITSFAEWSSFGCSSTSGDATANIMNSLNCQNANGHGCYGGYVWYTDLATVNWSSAGNVNTSFLYYKVTVIGCDNTILSNTSQTAYASNIKSVALANIPAWTGPPPTRSVANYNLSGAACCNVYYPVNNWWMLKVTYGRAFCSLQVL